ncbi:MAG: hypothetical protein ACO20G_07345 [Ilumatobacteraceae bacterium]
MTASSGGATGGGNVAVVVGTGVDDGDNSGDVDDGPDVTGATGAADVDTAASGAASLPPFEHAAMKVAATISHPNRRHRRGCGAPASIATTDRTSRTRY